MSDLIEDFQSYITKENGIIVLKLERLNSDKKIRYVIEKNKMYITGYLGEAVFVFNEEITAEFINNLSIDEALQCLDVCFNCEDKKSLIEMCKKYYI